MSYVIDVGVGQFVFKEFEINVILNIFEKYNL